MKKKLIALLFIFFSFPFFSLAQPNIGTTPGTSPLSLGQLLNGFFLFVFDLVWILAGGIAIIMFAVAGIKFLTSQGNPGKLEEARQAVIWAVVGTVVVILAFSAVWAIRKSVNI